MDSKHFQLEQVADGVYAAIAVEGTGSLGNAAIVDLGDSTLVFDTFYTVQAARDLKACAEQLTGRPASYVVNSHWHGDHINGNQLFAPTARIIATSRTRELMATNANELNQRHLSQMAEFEEMLRELEDKMNRETDERTKRDMQLELAGNREYLQSLPHLQLTLPTLTFERKLVIHGSSRSVELYSFGGGHTESDAFLYLPAERIALMGDLVQSHTHPMLRHGDAQEWVRILDQVAEMAIDVIVPGHGGVCTKEALHGLRTYLADLIALAERAARNGTDVLQLPVPEAYAEWAFADMYSLNLQVLVEKITVQC
jgi:cyclase